MLQKMSVQGVRIWRTIARKHEGAFGVERKDFPMVPLLPEHRFVEVHRVAAASRSL